MEVVLVDVEIDVLAVIVVGVIGALDAPDILNKLVTVVIVASEVEVVMVVIGSRLNYIMEVNCMLK